MINFKFILTAVFAICIVVGIGLFAISKGKDVTSVQADLVVWGTIPENVFNRAFQASSIVNDKNIRINYSKKDASSFDADFIEALADGVGPDIVVLREDSMYKERNKIFTIPYKNITERDFKDKFIEEGELFLTPEGILALPFIVDPMVMYWNRDLFSSNLIAQPPKYWDEVYDIVNKITRRDSNANILQSALALGEWRNITNAKEILLTLLFQSGTPVTTRSGGLVNSALNAQFGEPVIPSHTAVNFYTQFSNPTSASYSWNRSLPSSQNFFLAGNLAMYFGFASELFPIQQKNSNLNFDVTYIPQVRNSPKKTVFGHMYGLSIVKQSKQIGAAFIAVTALTEAGAIKAMETETSLPPVRRDLLADKPTDAYRSVFYNSALYSHSWIDPDSNVSQNIFRDMIESITSGRTKMTEALNRANEEIADELK